MFYTRHTTIVPYTSYDNTSNVLYDCGGYDFLEIEDFGDKPCLNDYTFKDCIKYQASLLWQYTDVYLPCNNVIKLPKNEFIKKCQLNNHSYIYSIYDQDPNPIELGGRNMIVKDISNNKGYPIKFEIENWLYDENYKFIYQSMYDKTTQTYYIQSNTENVYSNPLCLFADCE
jgi:hypothetical protein